MSLDIFTLLQNTETLPAPDRATGPPVLSLWHETTYYLMFFTLNPEKFASHYDADAKSYLCLSPAPCPACSAGIRATAHVYLPVWDAHLRRVAVLKFDTRTEGPAHKILPFLKANRDRLADLVAVVECKGRGEFNIVGKPPLPNTDRGALACEEFAAGLAAGAIELRNCVKRLDADAIAALPDVKKRSTLPVAVPAAVVSSEIVGEA